MSGHFQLLAFDHLQQHVRSLFPGAPLQGVVSRAEQEKEVNLLKETLGSERFFFTVDLQDFEIKECHGVLRWLGYPDSQFTLKNYWNLVHPGKQQSLLALSIQLYNTLCTGKFVLNFMVQRYSSLIALKHYRGHYLLVKKTASVFQYDKNNRLLSYLDEFTIVGDYNGEPLSPTFFTEKGDLEVTRGGQMMQQMMEHFMALKIFSTNEFHTARKLAYEPGITQAAIAKEFGVTVNTVDTYCRRFLQKSRKFFQQNFSNALEAAIYMRRDGLL